MFYADILNLVKSHSCTMGWGETSACFLPYNVGFWDSDAWNGTVDVRINKRKKGCFLRERVAI